MKRNRNIKAINIPKTCFDVNLLSQNTDKTLFVPYRLTEHVANINIAIKVPRRNCLLGHYGY